MIRLNIGNKWNLDFLNGILKLNQKYRHDGIQVTELYGNPVTLLYSAKGVRPDDRLPRIPVDTLKNYIALCKKFGIIINYTLNRSCVADMIEAPAEIKKLQDEINYLAHLGIKRFTVYSPYYIQNLKFPSLEVSTIHNNTDVNYIDGLTKLPGVKKICLPIYINRDFIKLRFLVQRYAHIKFECIVNEFCVAHLNTCIYRAECYNIQSHGKTTKYPFNKCSNYRAVAKNGVGWLKAPFILPQWLEIYHTLGIKHFKLTGRTHPTESILKVIEWYMKKEVNVSLEKLWGIGLPHQSLITPAVIPTRRIARSKFLNFFLKRTESCEQNLCGETCTFCHKMAKKLRRKDGV